MNIITNITNNIINNCNESDQTKFFETSFMERQQWNP